MLRAILEEINHLFMASWEKNGSSFWPVWQENKVFTVLLAILLVYSTVWVGAQIKKTVREVRYVGFADQAAPTITVSATGKATVVPDIATVDMSVVQNASTAAGAQQETSTVMNAVLDALYALEISKEDIQTSAFNTSELYDYDVSPAKVVGYQSTQTLTVKIRNTDRIASVLDAAPKKGATSVSGIRYSIDDETDLLATARAEAITKARAQARAIAAATNSSIGHMVGYSESRGGGAMPMYLQVSDSMKSVESAMPTVEVGTQDVEMTVYIVYALN